MPSASNPPATAHDTFRTIDRRPSATGPTHCQPGDWHADPDITPRLTALDIQLSGLAVTAARAERSAALAAMLALQIQKTSQEIYCLAHCALGYLALVDELPGTNEPLLVPAEFRRLSQLYLNPPDSSTRKAAMTPGNI